MWYDFWGVIGRIVVLYPCVHVLDVSLYYHSTGIDAVLRCQAKSDT